LTQNNSKDKVVEDWLSASTTDLRSAKVLYDNKLFNNSLYHLQQSNEKLAKGLLLSLGFLTPKTAKKDFAVRTVLGFLPKEPAKYRHRTMPSLLSDIEKSVPALDNYFTILESGGFGPKIAEFHRTIRRSKKGVQKLKKKPFNLIGTAEQLEAEIKATQNILDSLDQVVSKVNQELEQLDPQEMLAVATFLVREAGFKGDIGQPSFSKIKAAIIPILRSTMLAALSVAIASFLDPLESVTRYPDSQHGSFDESNPYVVHFEELYDVIERCLEKTKSKHV
jgi:hypothetical protein